MTFFVGLTGGIASGKSTVANLFKDLGIEVICSDNIARALTANNQPALAHIKDHFGAEILQENGELNRKKLRDIIFNHAEERVWLEQLLHPLIRTALQTKASQSKAPYCLIEIPLLYNKSDYPWLDRILVVTAPEPLVLSRLMQRDHCSEAEAKAIYQVQQAQVSYPDLADDLLVNTGNFEELLDKINQLHTLYNNYAQSGGIDVG